ncbi:MAG TPA: SUF system Fe-S cluster assembly protein [Gammaproteobacteria bacterium]|nr:SUF system Fe-S cluster assembly protein [Gammaproteobacteria bacterium]
MDQTISSTDNTGSSPQEQLRDEVIGAIKCVYDPEIPVDVYELGLIYNLAIDDQGHVRIDMTLTAPACPVADTLPTMVKQSVEQVAGVSSCTVELVWEPPWTPERLSEGARLQLGFM